MSIQHSFHGKDGPLDFEATDAFRLDKSHLALINEVSALVLAEVSSERVFAAVAERICEFFGFDTVAVYAGDPLTLRIQCGGIHTALGTLVPEGLAQVALRTGELVTSSLGGNGAVTRPPWTTEAVRSEAAFPLLFHDQPVAVLDLFSHREVALDQAAGNTLSILVRLLVVSAVQGQWARDDVLSEKQRRAYERLQEFAEFKDQILQNISHELRTPLTLAKGYLELLNTGQMGEIVPEQEQTLQTVLGEIDEIVAIIDRTVSLSSLNSFSMEYSCIPVAELLDELLVSFSTRAAASGITLDLQPVEADLCLEGDSQQIRQALTNILDNSVKFSPSGGRVSIEAQGEAAYVHLVFRDQGIGIPQQQLARIFDTFYQVDGSSTRRFGGLGLGLAVVSRVVRAHHGKVWAESEVDRGSAIHVLLPKDSERLQLFAVS
jgi:signal transduction histidine kinase